MDKNNCFYLFYQSTKVSRLLVTLFFLLFFSDADDDANIYYREYEFLGSDSDTGEIGNQY